MLPAPIANALIHDTRYPHVAHDNNELPFAFGGAPTARRETGFGTPADYTGSNDLVEGPDTVNGSINHGIFMDNDRWQPAYTGKSMVNFIRAKTTSKMQIGVSYETYSLSALNSKLKHHPEFMAEFDQNTAEIFMDTFRFYGVQQNEQNQSFSVNEDHFQNHHIARRARFPSYWSALDSFKTHRGSVRENDELWFLVRRYPLEEEKVYSKKQFRAVPRTLTHYWQIVPYVSSDHARPPESLWSDDDWVGGCIFVGWVHSIYGESRAKSRKHRLMAKQSLCPPSENDASWKKDFYTLAEVDVFLATG